MGIKRERCTAIIVRDDRLLCVRLEDPLTKVTYTVPPGGLIERGESPAMAAVREVLEETGYEVEIDPNSRVLGEYPFHWNGQDFDCSTHFFKGALASEKQHAIHDAAYHRGVFWVPLKRLDDFLNFHPQLYYYIKQLI